MTSGWEKDRRLAALASRQFGSFTSADLAAIGFTRGERDGRMRSARWEKLAPGVYRLTGAPTSFEAEVAVGLAWLGPQAVVSHRAAARLHGFEGFAGAAPEFTSIRRRRPNGQPWRVHTTVALESIDRATVNGLRATAASRTVIDLAACCQDLRALGNAIDSAVRLGLSSPAFLRKRLTALRSRGRRGVRLLDQLMLDSGGHTTLERAFLSIVRRAGLPRPRCQVVHRTDGRTIARVDFEWTEAMAIVEVSGQRGHASESERAKDARRQNELQDAGFVVYEFTTSQVLGDPDYVTATLARRLEPFMSRNRVK